MSLLAAVNYDPATVTTKSTAALLPMTAMDTTNLRVTFTPPSSGNVLVRLAGVEHGATALPQLLLGVLNGATVVRRVNPRSLGYNSASATFYNQVEAIFTVTGLLPTPVTWDAAYGVEVAVANTAIKYGGPDDAVTNNAFGAFSFEVWTA